MKVYLKKFVMSQVTLISALGCFALSPQAPAACSDGCNNSLFNVFQGDDALLNNTTGSGNAAFGWRSLFSDSTGGFNTGIGAGALVLNNADSNTAVGAAALLLNTTGIENTAVGTDALVFNDTGFNNNAFGTFALFSNTTGFENNAFGSGALRSNTTGFDNNAFGLFALLSNTTGSDNNAVGTGALESNDTGFNNNAFGASALFSNTGFSNSAFGASALFSNTTGSGNNAFGSGALAFNTTGFNNTALGLNAGSSVTTASGVTCIDHPGANVDDSCFIRHIRDALVAPDAAPVLIDSFGKLGTTSGSSRRFKHEIKPMDKASEAVPALRPVSFHYKADTKDTPQFGLIAEEVEKVNPDLLARDKDGKPYTVRYDAVNAMLLNEFLKEHRKGEQQDRKIEELEATVAKLKSVLKEQAAHIQRVNDKVEMNRSTQQMVVNDQ